jgi:hypothetical protein
MELSVDSRAETYQLPPLGPVGRGSLRRCQLCQNAMQRAAPRSERDISLEEMHWLLAGPAIAEGDGDVVDWDGDAVRACTAGR